MASQDIKLGTPRRIRTAGPMIRPGATGYGYDQRPSSSFAFFGVGMLLVGFGSRIHLLDRHTYRGGDSAAPSTLVLPK